MYKGSFKNASFFIQLLVVIALVLVGVFVSSIASSLFIVFQSGFSIEKIMDESNELMKNPSLNRTVQLFSTLGMILFPALLGAYLFSDDKKVYLKTETPVSVSIIFLSILSMLVVQPFINFTVWMNGQVRFPEFMKVLEDWMMNREKELKLITELMLQTNHISGLLLNLLIIGMLAAISEEFLFRGVLQKMFEKVTRNHHMVIWLVAILFSVVHMQFHGFFARVLMGAYFGYLLYYTQCIWVPVIAHFTNNAYCVLGYYYFYDTETTELDQVGSGSDWWIALISVMLWFTIFYFIRKKSLSKHLSS